MTQDFADSQTFLRVLSIERRLARGRLLVQPLTADTPTQLAGSAPMIWELLEEHPSVDALVPELQSRFTDSAETIAGGIRAAIAMFIDSSLVTTQSDAPSAADGEA